jgi:hypothetical protein
MAFIRPVFQGLGDGIIQSETLAENPYAIGVLQTVADRFVKGSL